MKECRVFADKGDLTAELADAISVMSRDAIAERGQFTVALSGGSLPGIVCPGLLGKAADIDFSKWHIFFADERCVALDHPDSNFGACDKALFQQVPVPTEQIYAIDPSLPPEACAEAYQQKLLEVVGRESGGPPSLDCLLLGMGPDGHTCSLFPGHPLLEETTLIVASISDSPKPPPERVTLTLPVLLAARNKVFMATGDGKALLMPLVLGNGAMVTRASGEMFQVQEEGLPDHFDHPAGMVCGEGVQWFIDEPAATSLNPPPTPA